VDIRCQGDKPLVGTLKDPDGGCGPIDMGASRIPEVESHI